MPRMQRSGVILCLISAVAFGAMGIFGKRAYDEGATVGTLLSVRFTLAAALLWVLTVTTGGLPVLRRLARRDVAAALALGAVGYGLQASAYFAALQRLDASLLSLLVYTYPVIVTVAAIALGRDRASRRTGAALALACSGLILVLAGAAAGALDPLGTALGLTAAIVYSAYILVSTGIAERLGPLALSTLVCTGAAVSLTLGSLVAGDWAPGAVSGAGLASLGGLALVSTVVGDLPVLRRAAPCRTGGGVDPVDPRAGRRGRPGVRGVRRVAGRRAARGRRARPARRARRPSPAMAAPEGPAGSCDPRDRVTRRGDEGQCRTAVR
jgi:drug/metabolite transporter (DMT)-like permease